MSSTNAADRPVRRGPLSAYALRMSLVYVLAFSLATSVLAGLLYAYAVRALDSETDAVISAELRGLAEQYQAGGLQTLASVINERVQSGSRTGAVYLLADPDLRPVVGNIAAWPSQGTVAERWFDFEVSVVRGPTFESRLVRAGVFKLAGGYRLLVGTDIHEREAFKPRIGWTLLASLLLTIVVGSVLGAWMNRHVLRRVDAISAAGHEIVEGNFSRRLPRSGSGDELDTLAANLNDMLDRVEQLTAALGFVIDSTAHDLRGPLNRMRGRIEAGLRSADSGAARRALEDGLRDAEALEHTLASLLRIAQAQGGAASAEIAPLDLGQLAAEVVELYEPVAQDRRIALELHREEPATVRGSRQLLAHALANLIDNALKFTQADGRVEVRVQRDDLGLSLVVADNGPGIPAEDRKRAQERFVRLAGSEHAPGSGLGLSLVAAVARMHRATLELDDNHPGLRVVLRFS
jgi:signal transduction histidine kinase